MTKWAGMSWFRFVSSMDFEPIGYACRKEWMLRAARMRRCSPGLSPVIHEIKHGFGADCHTSLTGISLIAGRRV